MRAFATIIALGIALGTCVACLPAQSEFVPVTVPVWTGDWSIETTSPTPTRAATPLRDACDARAPALASCEPVGYVRMGDVLTQPDCYLDTKVRSAEVGRVMRCASGAVVVFEHATFTGELAGDYLDVCKSTTYDVPQGDTCTWRTEQRIHGALSGALSFAYSEGPIAGRACTLACRAQSTVEMVH